MIISTIDVPSESQILKFVTDYARIKHKARVLQANYEGRHSILDRLAVDATAPNNKLVNSYPSYITDVSTGYFLGKPISYTSTDADYMTVLQDIFNYNDEAEHNASVGKRSSIKGTSFEILYIDEDNNIRFGALDRENVILVYDNKIAPEPSFAIRHYEIDNAIEDTEYIELYTKDRIYYYNYTNQILTLTNEVEHFFGGVPIVEYQNNDELQGDFEKELTLINAYDLVQSNSANMFEYNDDAILMIKNMSATEGKDVENAKKSRRVMVDGDGGLEWVTKDQSDQAIENYKTRLASDIHKFSKTPDLTDEAFSGNISGIAIEFKLWGLEQNASQKERKFKKGLQRRIELITNILNVRGGNYDWRDIKITFTRNMPTNAKEIVEMVNMLRGFLSNKTLISQLPFIGDVNEELELIEQEKDEAFDLLDDVEEVGDDIEREESTRTTEDDGQAGT